MFLSLVDLAGDFLRRGEGHRKPLLLSSRCGTPQVSPHDLLGNIERRDHMPVQNPGLARRAPAAYLTDGGAGMRVQIFPCPDHSKLSMRLPRRQLTRQLPCCWPKPCIRSSRESKYVGGGENLGGLPVMMRDTYGGSVLVNRIKALPDPYRRNAIAWLQHCTQAPIEDLETDINSFLMTLSPPVRAKFVFQTGKLLEIAVQHFGNP